MTRVRNWPDQARSEGVDHSTLLGALASTHSSSVTNGATRRVRAAGSLIFVVGVVLLFSACTAQSEDLIADSPTVEPHQRTSAVPVPPQSPTTTTSSTTASPTSTPTTTSSTTPAGLGQAPTTTAYSDIDPVLSRMAAKPAPVEIIQPSPPVASFTVGASDTEITISFAASGNGQIEWFTQVLPGGPATYRGKAPTIDITLTIPETKDTESYLVTADGKNPRSGEDSITILLVRGSS